MKIIKNKKIIKKKNEKKKRKLKRMEPSKLQQNEGFEYDMSRM